MSSGYLEGYIIEKKLPPKKPEDAIGDAATWESRTAKPLVFDD